MATVQITRDERDGAYHWMGFDVDGLGVSVHTYASAVRSYVNVTVWNATKRAAWSHRRGTLGRDFATFAEALGAYKCPKVRAAIEGAAKLHG